MTAEEQLAAAREVVADYGGWYTDAPEDSWRFERDIRSALGMPQYAPEEDN